MGGEVGGEGGGGGGGLTAAPLHTTPRILKLNESSAGQSHSKERQSVTERIISLVRLLFATVQVSSTSLSNL